MTWDERNWGMALKMPNPPEAYAEYKAMVDSEEETVPIDDLPNKDWLRAT